MFIQSKKRENWFPWPNDSKAVAKSISETDIASD